MSEKLGLAPAADHTAFNKKMAQALKATQHENQMLKEQLARLTTSGQIPSERRSTSNRPRSTERPPTASSERRRRRQVSGSGASVHSEDSRRRLQRVRSSQQRQQTDYSRSMPPQSQGNPQHKHERQKRESSAALRQPAPLSSALGSSRRERPIARIGHTRKGSLDDGHHL